MKVIGVCIVLTLCVLVWCISNIDDEQPDPAPPTLFARVIEWALCAALAVVIAFAAVIAFGVYLAIA